LLTCASSDASSIDEARYELVRKRTEADRLLNLAMQALHAVSAKKS
jgi:hypothetical protein